MLIEIELLKKYIEKLEKNKGIEKNVKELLIFSFIMKWRYLKDFKIRV